MLLDWGLARPAPAQKDVAPSDNSSGELRISGTPDYLSPEQAMGDGRRLDTRTDTYCLCVLFHELITLNHYLSPAETLVARLSSILSEEPISALQMHHRYGAPPELTNFIRPGLAKEPVQRYQSVDEMIIRLQAVNNGLIPVVCPCTGVKRFAHHYGDLLNSHPIVGLTILGLAGVFTLLGLFYLAKLVLS
jgi:serine/threonine-protein kinase